MTNWVTTVCFFSHGLALTCWKKKKTVQRIITTGKVIIISGGEIYFSYRGRLSSFLFKGRFLFCSPFGRGNKAKHIVEVEAKLRLICISKRFLFCMILFL